MEEIGFQQWVSIWPDTHEGYRFFQIQELSKIPKFSFKYIGIFEDAKLLGILPLFIAPFSLGLVAPPKLASWIFNVQKIFPGFLCLKTLFIGSPNQEEARVILPTTPEALTAALEQVDRALTEIRSNEGILLCVFKDFSDDSIQILEGLKSKGYQKQASLPTYVLDTRHPHLDSYLKTLSKSFQKDLEKKSRAMKAAPFQIVRESLTEATPWIPKIHTLYLKTLSRSETPFELLTEEYFRNFCEYLPRSTVYFLYWKIENNQPRELVAFNLCSVHDGILFDRYIGMDYEALEKVPIYHMSLLDNVEYCLSNGINKYILNQGGDFTKKRFQAIPENRWHLTRFSIPALDRMKSALSLQVIALLAIVDLAQFCLLFSFKHLSQLPLWSGDLPSALEIIQKIITSPYSWTAMASMIASFLAWPAVLSFIDLSIAFPLGAISYIVVPMLSAIFLREQIPTLRWLGIVLICLGIFIMALQGQPNSESRKEAAKA